MEGGGQREAVHIFVNTHTTCFLCLKDIPLNTNGVPEGFGSVSGTGRPAAVEKRNEKEVSLKQILKLVNFDPTKVFTNGPTSVANEVSVVLCDDCKNVAEKTSDFCVELEATKLRMTHWLEKFTGQLR